MRWHVYLLRCGNGEFYTGLTTHLERRIAEHQSGIGGRFTKAVRPVQLVYQETLDSRSDAQLRELQIKRWSRAKKEALAVGDMQALKRA